MSDNDQENRIHPVIESTVKELSALSPEKLARQFLELRSKAHRDSLTGVLNEDGVIDMFKGFVEVLHNTEEELRLVHHKVIDTENSHLIGFRGYGVWMVDLVGLHQTNEDRSLGWSEGDRKLKTVATTMQRIFKRSVDIIGRVGSDEFIVLSPNAKNDPYAAELMLNRLREALPEGVNVNMVIGWYDKDVNPEDAIANARKAMTEAKRNGPLDTTGRSLGFGLAKTGKYAE